MLGEKLIYCLWALYLRLSVDDCEASQRNVCVEEHGSYVNDFDDSFELIDSGCGHQNLHHEIMNCISNGQGSS